MQRFICPECGHESTYDPWTESAHCPQCGYTPPPSRGVFRFEVSRLARKQRVVFFILVGLAVIVAVLFSVPEPWKTILLALGPLALAAAIMFPARRDRKTVFFALVSTAVAVTLIYLSRDLLLEWVAKLPSPPPMAKAPEVVTAPPPTATLIQEWPSIPQGQIAFAGDGSIWVVDIVWRAIRQEKRRLTEAGVKADTPAWSPDGSWLAYAVEENGTWQIWTARADGTWPQRLTRNGGYWPTWSPDGSQIAYQSKLEAAGDIVVIPAAGGSPRQLTDDPAHDGHPAWSPDGQDIAFVSDRTGTVQIWLMKADGRSARQMTSGSYSHRHPAWSPDGRYLAYEKVLHSGATHVYAMDMYSGESELLNNGGFPVWSPDGQFLVVRMHRGPIGSEVWILRAEGVGMEAILAGDFYPFAWKK